MTTIAFKNGTLAGDSRITEGEMITPEVCRKVFRLQDGTLFGFCGDLEEAMLVKHTVEKRLPLPKLEPNDAHDTSCLHVRRDGTIWFTSGKAWVRVQGTKIASIGSGQTAAYAALAAGCSARRAVEIASASDPYTGGRIFAVSLRQRSIKKKVARSRRR